MVQACKIPRNHSRLVEYICRKHEKLYAQYLPLVLAEKEYLSFSQIKELQDQVQQLQQTIAWMESSKFWRLRQLLKQIFR
ncbi:MAG: hypothetical protein CV045_08135 [Cyanobacteria bacterium M5B4]|nr:MAG: hypothetical protein CV045_08135 [Cyanobacteria bacterium M5B4]